MALSGSNPTSTSRLLTSQKGYILAALTTLIPLLVTGSGLFLFSQFYLQNWMHSLQSCRSELLRTQDRTSQTLQQLMQLNPLARSLRLSLKMAQAELMAAIGSQNPAWVAKVTAQIIRIQKQRKQLDLLQKGLISTANLTMQSGVKKVISQLKSQQASVQPLLPDFFRFRIYRIQAHAGNLAVKPDRPDIAPVYELQDRFTAQQALHVSWISEFHTTYQEKLRWLRHRNKKEQDCSASLKEEGTVFREVLHSLEANKGRFY